MMESTDDISTTATKPSNLVLSDAMVPIEEFLMNAINPPKDVPTKDAAAKDVSIKPAESSQNVAELHNWIAKVEKERDEAVARAKKRYEQMMMAHNDTRNCIKAGKQEVAEKQNLQAKYDKLNFLLDCRDNTIAELQQHLAYSQETVHIMQSSSNNQQELEAKHEERLAAAKKVIEQEMNAKLEKQVTELGQKFRDDLEAKTTAIQKQHDEEKQQHEQTKQQVAALKEQLRMVAGLNEKLKLQIQQQLLKHQAKRKLDGDVLENGTDYGSSPMFGQHPSTASSDVPTDVLNKRRKVDASESQKTSHAPRTPSQQLLQLQMQISPSQRPKNKEEFIQMVNGKLKSLGKSPLSTLGGNRAYTQWMMSSSLKGSIQAGAQQAMQPDLSAFQPQQTGTQQAMQPGLAATQTQSQNHAHLKRPRGAVEGSDALPPVKKTNPNPLPPLPSGRATQPYPAGSATNPRTQSSTRAYQRKLPQIKEQEALQSFSPFQHRDDEITELYSGPAPRSQAHNLQPLSSNEFDKLYDMDYAAPPEQMCALKHMDVGSWGSHESINMPVDPSQANDVFGIGNLNFQFDVNDPSTFLVKSTEPSSFSVPPSSDQPKTTTGRITRSRSRSAAPQQIPQIPQIPQNTQFEPVDPSLILRSNDTALPNNGTAHYTQYSAAPQQYPYDTQPSNTTATGHTRQPSTASARATPAPATRASRARSTPAPSGPVVPVCLNCHSNWWNDTCDGGVSCQNCSLQNMRCERIRCLNYAAGTCTNAKCPRVHENHAYPHVVERPKTLKRIGKKGDAAPSPVQSAKMGV